MLPKEPSDLHLLFHSMKRQIPFTTQSRHVHIWLKLSLLSLLEFWTQIFFLSFTPLRSKLLQYSMDSELTFLYWPNSAVWMEAFVFECNLLLFAGFFINWISLVPSSCPIHCWETGTTGLTSYGVGYQFVSDWLWRLPFRWLANGRASSQAAVQIIHRIPIIQFIVYSSNPHHRQKQPKCYLNYVAQSKFSQCPLPPK